MRGSEVNWLPLLSGTVQLVEATANPNHLYISPFSSQQAGQEGAGRMPGKMASIGPVRTQDAIAGWQLARPPEPGVCSRPPCLPLSLSFFHKLLTCTSRLRSCCGTRLLAAASHCLPGSEDLRRPEGPGEPEAKHPNCETHAPRGPFHHHHPAHPVSRLHARFVPASVSPFAKPVGTQ